MQLLWLKKHVCSTQLAKTVSVVVKAAPPLCDTPHAHRSFIVSANTWAVTLMHSKQLTVNSSEVSAQGSDILATSFTSLWQQGYTFTYFIKHCAF